MGHVFKPWCIISILSDNLSTRHHMAPVIDVSLVFEVRCLVHGGWGWGGGCSECRHCNAFQAFWPDMGTLPNWKSN